MNVEKDIWENDPEDLLDDVITQLFLPRQTPETLPPNLEPIELHLQRLFCQSLENVVQKFPCPLLDPVKVMLEKWIQIQPKIGEPPAAFAELFCEEVKALQHGATLPIYVRNQNSTLLITKRQQAYQVATFRSSLPGHMVMSTVGSHSLVYPETVEIIQNVELLGSPEFASMLFELAVGDIDISLRKTTKGGKEYVETRDVADPFMVSDWVIGLLVPDGHQNSRRDVSHDTPQIKKKIRDQVTFSIKPGGALPFRRSGMYISLKVGLQLKIIQSFGDMMNPTVSKLVYKLLMLNILTLVAEKYSRIKYADLDTSCQIMAKLGMRVAKLETISLHALQASLSPEMLAIVTNLRKFCLQYTETVVARLSQNTNQVWSQISTFRETPRHPWDLSKSAPTNLSDAEENLNHKMPLLDDYVEKMQQIFAQPDDKFKPSKDILASVTRHQSADSILSAALNLSSGSFNEMVWLYDTENYLKYQCTMNEDGGASMIYKLFSTYTEKATMAYKNDPIGTSQLILVALKGLQLLDQIATDKLPLLKEYEPEVNVQLFDCLLLPFLKDMSLLDELVDYFSLRDRNAPIPSGILTNRITSADFSVIYAMQQTNMKDLRERILRFTKLEVDTKLASVNLCRSECQEMQRKNQAGVCVCEFEYKRWRNRYGQWRNRRRIGGACDNCRLFFNLQEKRVSMSYYERALPEEEADQWAVVFELLIPEEFAVWRDFLAYFKYQVLGEEVFQGKNQKHAVKWLDYAKLRAYKNGGTARKITLGSSSNPASTTYHTHTKLDVLTNGNDSYIIENGMSCNFHYEMEATPNYNVREACSFQLKDTSDFTPYGNLQAALTGTTHTQNSILARQYECHEQLALSEFVTFGSLRAGHRIQLRNLYHAIYSGTISLEQEPVLALVLQILWQVGPRNDKGQRESHLDFGEQPFAREFLDMLDNLVETNKANYSSSRIVLSAVLIARKIAEINPMLNEQCYRKLVKWREILKEWANKIQAQLDKLERESTLGDSLKKNLCEVLLSSRLSYIISDFSKLDSVMREKQDVVFWLDTLHHNSLNNNTNQLNLSNFMQVLLGMANILPLRLNVKAQLEKGKPEFLNALQCFTVNTIWNKGVGYKQMRFQYDGPSTVHIFDETQNTTVTLDLLRGASLVNGYSQSGLPPQVQRNPLFQRYFKNAANLRVQRENPRLTTSVTKFHGKHHEFIQMQKMKLRPSGKLVGTNPDFIPLQTPKTINDEEEEEDERNSQSEDEDSTISKNNFNSSMFEYQDDVDITVVIKEIQDDGKASLVLVDPEIFRGCISNYFLENHFHWLDSSQNTIYFRPDAPNLTVPPNVYILQQKLSGSGKVWTLYDIHSDEYILNWRSPGFTKAVSTLARLEKSQYINVTMKTTIKPKITAHLYRHHLKFTVTDGGNHSSLEYGGYSVSDRQLDKGTLIGLRQGLILQTQLQQGDTRKMLLVPHSSIKIKSGRRHQNVDISQNRLKQPPCFVYEFDDVLQRLKAHNSKPAWLYLAALHAATSSPLPDPYTRITGTEMAVRILQSASVWSGSPYDKESRDVLTFIKTLSPKRKYYGLSREDKKNDTNEDRASMELIEWPEGISSVAAYDGFGIIVDTLFQESERLTALYVANGKDKNNDNERVSPLQKLRLRAYFRHLSMYNPLVAVEKPQYFGEAQLELLDKTEGLLSHLQIRQWQPDMQLSNLTVLSTARWANNMAPLLKKGIFKRGNLTGFLLTEDPLDASLPGIPLKSEGGFYDVLHLDFRFNWLKLYLMAIICISQEEIHTMTGILCTVVYRGAPVEQVANLHVISQFAKTFEFPVLPNGGTMLLYSGYSDPSCNDFDEGAVMTILQGHPKPFSEVPEPTKPSVEHLSVLERVRSKRNYEQEMKEYESQKESYFLKIKASCAQISSQLKSLIWPSDKIQGTQVAQLLNSSNIESVPVIEKINEQLTVWYRNYKLKLFVEAVQTKLNLIYDQAHARSQEDFVKIAELAKSSTKCCVEIGKGCGIDMTDLLDPVLAVKREETREIFETGRVAGIEIVQGSDYIKMRVECQNRIEALGSELWGMMTGSPSQKIITQAKIGQRLDPGSLLQVLRKTPTNDSGRILQEYAGAYGVLKTHLQQINRCLQATQETELEREISNPGHENWSPAEYPEWLLLELELNLKIRPVQVEVAHQMITMPNGKNGVTQLNMGEGKTSVIVPMLCAVLAKKDVQLCRVTVLSSMFNMNLASLAFSIGGLLNRRVYSLPCRRDLDIDEICVERIAQVYKECMNLQGVVLTLPEHRLSFRLLGYDKILKKETTLGLKMLQVENWLRYYARDVLDESDELFNVKYQLVYTVGEQLPIDGGDLRWTTCQRILSLVQKAGEEFLSMYGPSVMEFDPQQNRAHQFSPIRILNAKYLSHFAQLIADIFLNECGTISEDDKPVVNRFLVEEEISLEDHGKVMKTIFKEDLDTLNKVLLFSGYLKRCVLGLALMKRWRVEYGINPMQGFRRMAVPFRAKDVAAEKTEFGHPDLAILLTHLSYYYAGLSDRQLQETFDILKGKKDPKANYSSWIADIPDKEFPENSKDLKEYKSLNLKDAGQRGRLFDLLRKHKMVIDFWLSHAVFPRECRQFPGKLLMTAWDLCYERQRFPVTGFSGTNDSQILLPMMISQQDLAKLQNTNDKMESILLQPENGGHRGFDVDVKCKEILDKMKDDNLNILIDAGALMLALDNEQVATKWLEINSEIEAAVYFTKNNHLFVKCRGDDGEGTPFDASPFQGRLDKCAVFLDDQHTRGTDIKFPAGAKACVTVGTRMKREKLIQACMRMRKLGQGHSVTFYLSHEAHCKVMNSDNPNGPLPTKAVLDWVRKNTEDCNSDGLLYWALAGKNYAQRLAPEDNFHFPNHHTPLLAGDVVTVGVKADILADQCVDDEVIKLKDMYGQHTQIQLLHQLVPKWFASAKNKLLWKNKGREMPTEVFGRYDDICRLVENRCIEYVPQKTHVSSNSGMMEEEQERELELEKETEVEQVRMVERPKKATEAIPRLHPNVRNLVLNGGLIAATSEGVVRLCDMFAATSFRSELQPEGWRGDVFATKDFVSVIQGRVGLYHNTDDHLRPVQYLVSFQQIVESGERLQQLLVLSPFEVNALMPYFRSGQTQCTLHMFSYRRTEKQDLLLNNSRLQFPWCREGIKIEEDSKASVSLLLASGNLYFISMAEQEAFLNFLGLAFPPWSKEEKEACEKGLITKTGFLPPEFCKVGPSSGFLKDPTGLVKKILMCWHPFASELAHVMRLLDEKSKIRVATYVTPQRTLSTCTFLKIRT